MILICPSRYHFQRDNATEDALLYRESYYSLRGYHVPYHSSLLLALRFGRKGIASFLLKFLLLYLTAIYSNAGRSLFASQFWCR